MFGLLKIRRTRTALVITNLTLGFLLCTSVTCFSMSRGTQKKLMPEVKSKVPPDFSPPYPFTKQEFLVNLGKVLSAKDGVVRKEAVAKAFQIEIPNKPRDEDLADYPEGLIFRILPGRDWYIEMKLVESKDRVHFHISFDSYFCIGVSEFRRFADGVDWEMIVAATLSGHMASPREHYRKRGGKAELFFDMGPYLQCIGSIHVSTQK